MITDHTFRPYLDGRTLFRCAWNGTCNRRLSEHAAAVGGGPPLIRITDHAFRPTPNNPDRGNRDRCAWNGTCDRPARSHAAGVKTYPQRTGRRAA